MRFHRSIVITKSYIVRQNLITNASLFNRMMSFKVVKFIAGNRVYVEACPSSWEDDGKLSWPRNHQSMWQKTADSTPQDDWHSYTAQLMQENLDSFEEASDLATALVTVDTDGEEA